MQGADARSADGVPVTRVDVGGVAVLAIDNPPVNALSAGLRAALLAALQEAEADPAIAAVVVGAEGRTWPAGADIREFDLPPRSPELPELCNALAASVKPVVAALHGTVLGGGLELALAMALRVAAPSTRLGFPEVALGLLPGAGGTQRAPRMIGAAAALDMMLSGVPVTAERARAMGLVDVVADDVIARAIELARGLARGAAPPPRPRPVDGPDAPAAFLDAVARARAQRRDPRLPAPQRIVDCVEASLVLPAEEGAVFERSAFAELRAAPQSAALRHMFLSERQARRHPELDDVARRNRKLAVVAGWGDGAADMVRILLAGGLSVTLFDSDTAGLTRTIGRVASGYDRAQGQGAITPEARAAQWARFEGATATADLNGAELFVDLAPRDPDARAQLLDDLDRRLDPDAILALGVSGPELDAGIAASGRPASVLGLMPAGAGTATLYELIASPVTSREAIGTVCDLLQGAGRLVVRTGLGDGSILERLAGALRRAADGLVDMGISPYAVDRAMEAWGMSPAPYLALDRQGLIVDAEWRLRQVTLGDAGRDDSAWIGSGIGAELLTRGWTGQAAGHGYYLHDAPGPAREDPEVVAIMRARLRDQALRLPPDAIVARLLAALANEGARLIDEGIARRPADIDLVAVAGLAVARWRGGPMQVADGTGLLKMRNELKRLAATEGASQWRPAALWDTLIRNGRRFGDLNAV